MEETLKMHWFKLSKWIIQAFCKKCKFREDDLCNCGLQDDNEHAIKIYGLFYNKRRKYSEVMRFGNLEVRPWLKRRDKERRTGRYG